METDEPVIIQIVEQVAAQKGVDPLALHPPLHDVIDTDALEALFRSAKRGDVPSTVTLEFVYQGYTVRVDSGGHVHVSESSGIGVEAGSDSGSGSKSKVGSESRPIERSSR